MSEYKVGDRVRITDVSKQRFEGLAVGDVGTVIETIDHTPAILQEIFGGQPLFVKVDGKPTTPEHLGEEGWSLASSEVELVTTDE